MLPGPRMLKHAGKQCVPWNEPPRGLEDDPSSSATGLSAWISA